MIAFVEKIHFVPMFLPGVLVQLNDFNRTELAKRANEEDMFKI